MSSISPSPETSLDRRAQFLRSCLDLLLIVPIYLGLLELFRRSAVLPEQAYFSKVIVVQALTNWRHLGIWLLLSGALIIRYREIGWSRLEDGNAVRLLVFSVAAALAWSPITYDLNLYYNVAHYPDRLLLLALTLLILVHPAFLLQYLWVMMLVWAQAKYPIDSFSSAWFERMLPIELLVAFSAFCYARTVRRCQLASFTFLVLCLTGASYFRSGYLKVSLPPHLSDWVLLNQISNLFVSSWLNGWLAFLSEGTVLAIANTLSFVDVPVQAMTLAIELGGLMLLLGRRFAMTWLGLFLVMHVGIVISSGIFFWKWMATDLALMVFLWRHPQVQTDRLFHWGLFLVSIPLVVGLAANQPGAYWFDSRINNHFTIEAISDEGDVYVLDRDYFAPYDLHFSQSFHQALVRRKLVAGTYGTVHSFRVFQVVRSATRDQYEGIRSRFGRVWFRPRYALQFDRFMKRFFANLNRRGDRWILINAFGAPRHIQQHSHRGGFDGEKSVRSIRVRLTETFYDGDRVHVIRNEVVREIAIPQG